MKFKKILSSVVAAAMAVTTFSAFSTTATAADTTLKTGGSYTAAPTSWDPNTIDTTFTTLSASDLSVVENDALITITVVPNAGADTSDWAIAVGETMTGTWANSGGGTATKLEVTAQKLLDIAGIDSFAELTSAYNVQIWNIDDGESIDSWSISYDNDYVAPTTDVWVDNGDGSYSLTRGTAASPAKFTIPLDDGENHIATAVAITVEGGDGYTNGCLGSMVYDGNPGGTWENVTWDEESAMAIYNPSSSLETYPEFQVWYAAVGTKITISLVQSVYAYTKYEQQTDDGSACRGIMYIQESEVENIESVDFYFSNDGGATTKKVSSTKYYESVSVGGNNMTAPEGYVIVAYAITNIPDGESVTCEDIDLNRN